MVAAIRWITGARRTLLAVGLSLLLLPQSLAAADDAAVIDSFGTWTLEELGYGDLNMPVSEAKTFGQVEYRLPPAASQGPDGWYIIHLHSNVEIAEDTGEGYAILSARAAIGTMAQIEYVVAREGDSLTTSWNSLDFVNGRMEEVASSRNVEVRFMNYFTRGAVKPGDNTLVFKLETFRDIKVNSFTVFSDSAIEYTPLAPPDLKLEVELPEGRVKRGEEFSIGYRLSNEGYPASGVEVAADYPGEALALLGETPHLYTSVGEAVDGAFTFEATRAGSYVVAIGVEGPTRDSVTEIQVVVDRPAATWTKVRPWVIGASVAIIAVVLVLRVVRRAAGQTKSLGGGE